MSYEIYDVGGIDSNRLKEFIETKILSKSKNKLIIMDNASSHRNEEIKNLINKKNTLLHSIVYQHFTNAIENFFSVLKSKLHKLEGLTLNELKANVEKAINEIPKETYYNIINATYNKPDKYEPKRRPHKDKNYK